jgi:hypothetical protein
LALELPILRELLDPLAGTYGVQMFWGPGASSDTGVKGEASGVCSAFMMALAPSSGLVVALRRHFTVTGDSNKVSSIGLPFRI